ncbi:MAG: SUMF1/EgtB/PvdO family nonheme iron enzyme [Verrucomicrobiota bacterium]
MLSPGLIFISYRRSDSIAETGRIYDRLVAKFGRDRVFKDVDSIPFGVNFAEYLDQAVSQCEVVLVAIGKTWLNVTDKDGVRRLDKPDDFVRIEVESALQRNIPVIPLLLQGASMPCRSQLPKSLQPLVRRNGIEVGYDPRFHNDMNRLVKNLESSLKVAKSNPEPGFQITSQSTLTIGIERENELKSYVNKKLKTIDLNYGISITLSCIPSGKFQMGAPDCDKDSDGAEKPQHEVNIPGFWMSIYPVTQAQYQVIMGKKSSYFSDQEASHPVTNVSWNDAKSFCEKITQLVGMEFRLPSESEWEYACRAGTKSSFYFGEELTDKLANFNGNDTTSVGSFPANEFQLYDMHGNVYEWCQDHWHNSYHNAPRNGLPWLEKINSGLRVLRGGAWRDCNSRYCRSTYRISSGVSNRRNYYGFRVVCPLQNSI